jgi:DNA modification methylase
MTTAEVSNPCTIINSEALVALKSIPDNSIQCCVTSPPYWNLRDYGVAGQIGLEDSPTNFIKRLVLVFSEVRRVLKEDGTCWVNMGDTYCSTAPCSWGAPLSQQGILAAVRDTTAQSRKRFRHDTPEGMKPKDLVGIPWMLAFALRADGWYLRSDIIWHKPNPMPESVSDRPTKTHEYIFLLSKTDRYYYDQEAILEPVSENTHSRISQNLAAQVGSDRANGGAKTNGNMKAVFRKGKTGEESFGVKNNPSFAAGTCLLVTKRNKRTVWTVPTYSFSDAHFATYPPDLIKPCILAGSRAGDTVIDPFAGSGTTGQVALELGRKVILIELNPDYIPLIQNRTRQTGLPLA